MGTESRFQLKVIAHRKEQTPFTLAIKSFLLSREAMGCTENTLGWYRNYLGKILIHFEGQEIREISAIRPDDIRALYVCLQRRGLAEQTIFNYATVMRAFLNYLKEEELLTTNPMNKVKMPRLPKRILPAFSPDDVRRILDACQNARDTAMVLCLVDSGCRAAEFITLNIGDIDIENGTVTVQRGKGKKDRITFIGVKARKAVLKYLMERDNTNPDMPLWLSMNTGERLTTSGLRLMLGRVGKRSGVKHCHPHTFRRTCALWSLRAGMNIYALQQIMGHADLTVLRRYLALVQEDLEDAHRKHGAVDNML